MEITLGQQYNVGEKPTVILYTYINRYAGTPENYCIKSTNITLAASLVQVQCVQNSSVTFTIQTVLQQ